MVKPCAIFLSILFFATGFIFPQGENIYDESAFQRARELALSGKLEEAVTIFEDTLRPLNNKYWSLAIEMSCDSDKVLDSYRKAAAIDTVYILHRLYEGKSCYRIAAGIEKEKSVILKLKDALPQYFMEKGPFPVKIEIDKKKKGEGKSEQEEEKIENTPNTKEHTADESKALFQEGLAYQQSGKYDDALIAYKKSLARNPNQPSALNNIAAIFILQQHFTDAESAARQAVYIDPAYERAYINLAGALWGQGRVKEAITNCEKAISLNFDDPEAHYIMAGLKEAIHDFDNAKSEAKECLLLKPDHKEAKALLIRLEQK